MSFYNWDALPLTHDRPGVTHRRIFGDNIQMQHLIVQPGGEPAKLHNHPGTEEFFYIQAGAWAFTLGDEVRNVGPGDVVHVKAGTMHTLRLLSDEPGMVLEVFHPIWDTDLAKDWETSRMEGTTT
jgi:mannose-6-phosphate isomerase-like protein (cupin superfamily)